MDLMLLSERRCYQILTCLVCESVNFACNFTSNLALLGFDRQPFLVLLLLLQLFVAPPVGLGVKYRFCSFVHSFPSKFILSIVLF